MLTDFYQLTMMNGYFKSQKASKSVVFDLFFRKNPCSNGYSIAAGLEQALDYVENISFDQESIVYLREQKVFDEDFLKFLKGFKFTGNIYAVPEGTAVFPSEPLVRVEAPLIEAQFIETALLNIINHQSLIATKAARVKWAAGSDRVLEFGLRRAQGPDAGIYGARAAIIGGCDATSNLLAGHAFNIPISGTHAHSWVMSFDSEYEAFEEYAKIYPNKCLLLADTYDTLKSGIPNAIKVFAKLKKEGYSGYGIRLDSGDMAYLSKKARTTLDESGYPEAVISASGDLDEYLITDLKLQGAKITVWGVGTNLITSYDCPAFGGVYKMSAEMDNNNGYLPKIKISNNPAKITNPGVKKIVRLYDSQTGKIKADLIALDHEIIDSSKPLTLYDPMATWKRMTLFPGYYQVRELLIPVMKNGIRIYHSPDVLSIKEYCRNEMDTLWDEFKRLSNPHILPVDLSDELYNMKKDLIKQSSMLHIQG